MAILTLPRFVEELQAYAALQLLRRLLVDNQGLCRDGGLWGTVGVKELRGQYPNIGHALECILLCVFVRNFVVAFSLFLRDMTFMAGYEKKETKSTCI